MLILLLLFQLAAPADLTAAAARGDRKEVARLLEAGVKPDDPAALALAAASGKTDIATLLLKAKANPNATWGDPPRSPIFYAIENNRRAMVQLLADNGVDLDLPLPGVGAPLHWAAQKGTVDILLALVNPPTNVRLETKDEQGYTALQRAVLANRLEAVRLLLNYGAEPLNALELAKDPAMVQLLQNPPRVKPGHREIQIRM